MAIDTLYVPLFNIEEVILDKDTGLPLSGGVVRFWRDEQRTQPKEVFQISGSSPNYTFVNVGAVFTLGISGTFVDGSGDPFVPYAYPYDAEGNEDRYYVTVESAGAVAQFVREAVPYLADGGVPPEERSNTNNELVNPQFVSVLFDTASSSHTYNVTGSNTVTPVAPGWDLISSGTGTIEVEWLATSGAAVDETNPPYALRINASAALGGTIILRQRFSNSPRLLAGNYGSATFTAAVISGGDTAIALRYVPSTGTTVDIIPATAIPTDTAFHTISNNAALPTDNTDSSTTGYVDIQLEIPTARNIKITSIQLVGINYPANIPFDEQSVEEQINGLFNYYKPQLEFKPIPSLLTGWDFPLNPRQFGVSGTVSVDGTAGQGGYVWDQLICGRSGGNFSFNSSSITQGIQFTSTTTTTAFYMMQYLSGNEAKKILGNPLSVNVFGYASTNDVVMRIHLFRGSSAASIPTLPNIIGTMSTSGIFTLTAANWTEISRSNFGIAHTTLTQLTANNIINQNVDYGFNGWEITDNTQIGDTDKFAIVVTFYSPSNGAVITVNSIGLAQGDIPTRPAPQSIETVLSECSYYYEKSWDNSVTIGTADSSSCVIQEQSLTNTTGVTTTELVPRVINFSYKTAKRVNNPTVSLYATGTGTINNVTGVIFNNGSAATSGNIAISTRWSIYGGGSKRASYRPSAVTSGLINGSATLTRPEAWVEFNYTVDARLGVI